MSLTIVERETNGVCILELSGELKLGEEADQLAARLHMLLKARPPRLVLKMEKVTQLDSVGIGTIVDAVREARRSRGDVCLLAPSARVRGVLAFLQLDRHPELLPIFATEQEAVASFSARGGSPP